ncbi:pre-mRNA cleavage complex 2 protein Pcf11 [Nephila pilipes]|uniref:Pre-mRNA cleavage complex 2 protein Pcf11 n=1 Tax=Nephila pilipes TaxID=299642 RepID=A0A8X6PR19_NEPPI|nr:pre-mRNA cleavage complex 2 protein Pcf11 [Nephila pilipes]
MAEAVAEEYRSSLCDLNFNSKPHINMLTMLAEENNQFAPLIVDTIVSHIKTVQADLKLPSLYLVDSIMKNIGGQYITIFSKHMVSLFTSVFAKVDEPTRSALYKLRQTWNEILSKNVLYDVDCHVKGIDPAWPITAEPTVNMSATPAKIPIHVNPKFIGGNATQASNPPRNQGKPPVKKNETAVKDNKEYLEIRKKQQQMLKLIEEKKTYLKALEQKKLEMAAQQKKKAAAAGTLIESLQNVEKKALNHRDPRLKKNALIVQPSSESAKNPHPLQSVVIVPKVPADFNENQVENEVSKSVQKIIKTEPQCGSVSNEALHSSDKVCQDFKNSVKNEYSDRFSKENNKEKHISNKSKNIKFQNKKHPLSHDKNSEIPAKMLCKDAAKIGKRPLAHASGLHLQTDGPAIKKGKYGVAKIEKELDSKEMSRKVLPDNQRVKGGPFFEREDKDYRHHLRNTNIPKPKSWPQQGSQNRFYSRDGKADNMHMNEQKNVFIRDPENRIQIDHSDKMQKVEANLVTVKTDISESTFNSKPVSSRDRLPLQQTKTFMLDGKNRKLYFVNDRCFTIMDNNEPRELIFSGVPRNVYVEGLPKPLILGFDGQSLEFETEGKRNSIRFGAPSREVYVNNYPYEVFFGGQPFTATLEDKKEHRIRIDGPPPQVIVSEQPAYDLYEMYNQDKRISPILDSKGPDMLQDVDMRPKSSHLMKPSVIPESTKDIDWRHVALAERAKIPWNMQNDVPSRSYSSQPGVSGASLWDPVIHCENSILERNSDAPWPHPSYREVVKGREKSSFDQPLPLNHKTPTSTWELQPSSSLPPPPAIPPSLSLPPPPSLPSLSSLPAPPMPNMHQLPNMNVPPPSWNPLPPPPMFTGSVPDTLKPTTLSTTIATNVTNIPPEAMSEPSTSIPSLPINVETIYEKLVAAGIIAKKTEEPSNATSENGKKAEIPLVETKDITPEEEETPEPEISLTAKSLRQYLPNIISALYKGSQCATCGMRFKEVQSEQYSRHLDWHFRMNRREKDGAKKAYSRRLFYEFKDWIQFKEIEEAEERTPSYFELQADGEMSKNEEKEKVQSVPASECETEKCSVCGEQFQLFWVEEEEEWHLKHAVRHDGEAYHPMCYEDFKKAKEQPKKKDEESSDSAKEEEKSSPEETTDVKVKEEKLSEDEKEPDVKVKEEKLSEDEKEPNVKIKEEKLSEEETDEKPEITPKENDSPRKEPNSESEIPMDISESVVEISQESSENKPATAETEPAAEIIKEVDSVNQEASTLSAEIEETAKGESVEQAQPEKSSAMSSDTESENLEDEFRPPTPDPRFSVQPPVSKGTELSALCTIM